MQGPNTSSVFSQVIVISGNVGQGLFVYAGAPGAGNFPVFAVVAPGILVDPYGNLLSSATTVISDSIKTIAPIFASGLVSLTNGPFLFYGNQNTVITTLTGSGNFTAPTSVTSMNVFAIGGGAGGVASGGGGGEYASQTVPVTPGNLYAYTVGAGGPGGTNGGNTSIASDTVTTIAHGGLITAGGSGSTATTHHNGGNGGTQAGFQGGGGGGGGAGGPFAPGNNGGNASGVLGGAGAPAVSGNLAIVPGPGGAGGNNNVSGHTPTGFGGGGGGRGFNGIADGAGANGTLVLLYSTTTTMPLLASIAQSSGTDPNTGTAYGKDIISYDPVFGIRSQLSGGFLRLYNFVAGNFVNGSLNLSNGGQITVTVPSSLTGTLPISQTDATVFTVTAAALTQASKAWSIPAADANVGTWYRLTVYGFGTQGSTAQNLSMGVALNGTTIRSATGAAITASGSFRWKAVIDFHVLTTGTSGTADCNVSGTWGAGSPEVENTIIGGSASAGQEAINTTIANTLSLTVGWAAVTGAPTITSIASLLERLGP